MSALVVFNSGEHVLFACDGVAYEYETGDVTGFTSKITLLPHLSCIIGATGVGGFNLALQWEIGGRYSEFDELVADFRKLMIATHTKGRFNGLLPEDEFSRHVVVAIGGWSNARQRHEAYRMANYGKRTVDPDGRETKLEPFKLMPIETGWCNFSPSDELVQRFGVYDAADDLTSCIRMICASRADSGVKTDPDTGRDYHFNAGGFIQLAVLKGGRVDSSIIHRWPEDVIGRPIEPSLGQALPPFLTVPEAA